MHSAISYREVGLGKLASSQRIWRYCPRRVYARARKTLKVVLTHRLHLGWSRPDAAELRAYAKASGDLAEK